MAVQDPNKLSGGLRRPRALVLSQRVVSPGWTGARGICTPQGSGEEQNAQWLPARIVVLAVCRWEARASAVTKDPPT